MKILCKLTDKNDQTRNSTQWGEGVTHTASGKGELCTDGWIHYYDSPLLAVLLNPIYGDFKDPHLWKISVNGKIKTDHGLKYGTTSLTTIKRIPLPKITTTQKIIFGILCAMEVYHDEKFQLWGEHWIDGSDRSAEAAEAAARAAWAAWAAEAAWAAWAAKVAARAARAAARAARAAWAAEAARAAEAAKLAAEEGKIDLHALAEKALTYKDVVREYANPLDKEDA